MWITLLPLHSSSNPHISAPYTSLETHTVPYTFYKSFTSYHMVVNSFYRLTSL
jgi:hypothetical protein